jgi:predicted house-cleaning noncanonical NTP pyrophosphatase (MazG superfamily)
MEEDNMLTIYENELPMPVRNDGKVKVVDYTHRDWVLKIKEEVAETMEAGSPEEMAEEITDIITVCTSWLEAVGYDANERRRLCIAVNLKNQSRGYLDFIE